MRIGILGAGNVGGALARVWKSKGHEVMFGVPDARSERTQKTIATLGGAVQAGSNADAAAFGETTVLTVPWPAARQGRRCGRSRPGCRHP